MKRKVRFSEWLYWKRFPTWMFAIGIASCFVGIMCLPFGYIHERNFTSAFAVSSLLTGAYVKYGAILFGLGIIFLCIGGIIGIILSNKFEKKKK